MILICHHRNKHRRAKNPHQLRTQHLLCGMLMLWLSVDSSFGVPKRSQPNAELPSPSGIFDLW